MDLYDVVKKLTGPVVAVGETNEDARRLNNLKTLTELVQMLMSDIADAAMDATRHEASMRVIGEHAKTFLLTISARD